jgi:TonB family protein
MVAQAKEISNARRGYDSLSLLEDVVGLRLSLATDAEDQAKWQAEFANARESLASTQTQLASLGGIPPLRPSKTPVNTGTALPYSTKKATDGTPDVTLPTKGDAVAAKVVPPPSVAQPANSNAIANPSESNANEQEVSEAGSLNAFATKKVVPQYPVIAKQSGASGMVRVHVVVEGGKVISVKRSEGPMLLRQAAEDAARQWLFQVISVEGRPTRLSGYIDFNFTL